MTVSESNQPSSTEKFILWALIISLLLHLLAFSLWRVGKAQGWWQNLAMPRWMQLVTKTMLPLPPKKLAQELPSQTQLTFVEVDPALARPEPPKKPLFQGAKNTLAANREIKTPSLMPNIDGQQKDILKTTENLKHVPKPVQPKPAALPEQAPKVAHQNAPQKSYLPGDLAMVRPSDKRHEGIASTETETNQQVQPQPQPQPAPAYERPRTIAAALAESGNSGLKSALRGGVRDIRPDTSLDVQGTPMGDYFARMVDAVDYHWHKLLENQSDDLTGRVMLRFRLHSDGSVTDVRPLKNEVSDLLEAACESGVKDPAPFGKWPAQMREQIGSDYYDITFTFYYELY